MVMVRTGDDSFVKDNYMDEEVCGSNELQPW